MVLIASERTWTLSLCSIYVLHNTIQARSWKSDKNKGPVFLGSGVLEKNYQFEDFFWTGSGDGPLTEDFFRNVTEDVDQSASFDTWRTTTVFHTTTILFATVYPNGFDCSERDCMPEISPVTTKSIDFSLPAYPSSEVPQIEPTPTAKIPDFSTAAFPVDSTGRNDTVPTWKPSTPPQEDNFFNTDPQIPRDINKIDESVNSTTTVFPEILLDQKYWLLTILRNDNYLPNLDVNATEMKLSNLYRQAFTRREEKFYGNRKGVESVKVHIVNVTQIGADIGLVYSVTVSGKPIPASAAANDMRLMTPSEVIAELGRPILTKAEPYVKVTVPLGARIRGRARDTWLLIGCVIAAICLLMLVVGLFALALSKKQNKKKSGSGEEEGGTSNLGFDEETDTKAGHPPKPPRASRLKPKSSGKERESVGGTVKFKEDERRGSSTSSTCSGSSEAELVQLRSQQTKRDRRREEGRERPRPKPRTRERRIQSSDCKSGDCKGTCLTSAGSVVSKNTFNDSAGEEYSPRVTKSPTSYLSMPSVKAFPRGTKIPEPINKILEPTSIRHLDADSDSQKESSRHVRRVKVEIERGGYKTQGKYFRGKEMTRHGSLEGDDPGVIGPVVWNKHCQKMFERDTDILNEDQCDSVSVRRMRKRFNELLDDALSMFGSSSGSPERNDPPPPKQPDNRVHSAVLRPAGLGVAETSSASRPYTTGSKRPSSSTVSGPKGAWETPSCSTLARPYSAGIYQEQYPTIDKDLIHVNSELSPNDPAISLIAAIKNELKKFEESPRSNNAE